MTSSESHSPYGRSIRRVVRFAQTEADQVLLQAAEEALENQFHGNFSALCKQALRHFLLPGHEGQAISPVVMQEQIMELQERVALLEAMGDPCGSGKADRLGLLEMERGISKKAEDPPEAVEHAEPEPAIDPLLSRLAPFLEDF